MIAISPDQPALLIDSLDVKDLGYALYSDASMAAARAMGIAFRLGDDTYKQYRAYGIDLEHTSGEQHHQLPVPSVFLVEAGGKILWNYSNPDHRVRPDNEAVMAAARASKLKKTDASKD